MRKYLGNIFIQNITCSRGKPKIVIQGNFYACTYLAVLFLNSKFEKYGITRLCFVVHHNGVILYFRWGTHYTVKQKD